MGKIYHIACFTCTQCQINLQGKPFYALEGKPCCEEDYLNTLEKCSVCMKIILQRILRANGKSYHPDCFCCVVCSKSLDSVPFTVDATNQNHCISCFHKWVLIILKPFLSIEHEHLTWIVCLQEICTTLLRLPCTDHARTGEGWNHSSGCVGSKFSCRLLQVRGTDSCWNFVDMITMHIFIRFPGLWSHTFFRSRGQRMLSIGWSYFM